MRLILARSEQPVAPYGTVFSASAIEDAYSKLAGKSVPVLFHQPGKPPRNVGKTVDGTAQLDADSTLSVEAEIDLTAFGQDGGKLSVAATVGVKTQRGDAELIPDTGAFRVNKVQEVSHVGITEMPINVTDGWLFDLARMTRAARSEVRRLGVSEEVLPGPESLIPLAIQSALVGVTAQWMPNPDRLVVSIDSTLANVEDDNHEIELVTAGPDRWCLRTVTYPGSKRDVSTKIRCGAYTSELAEEQVVIETIRRLLFP